LNFLATKSSFLESKLPHQDKYQAFDILFFVLSRLHKIGTGAGCVQAA